MIVLTLRTDKPDAVIGLFNAGRQITYYSWQAHRKLSETIHVRLREQLESQKLTTSDIEGVVVYKGPGSFTGIRIGLAVANALATTLDIPIVGTTGDEWLKDGLEHLQRPTANRIALAEYGAPVHVTAQRK